MKHRHVVRLELHSLAPVWLVDVWNPQNVRSTDANRSAVGVLVLGRDLHVLADGERRDGFHADHQGPRKVSRRATDPTREVHGHVAALFSRSKRDSGPREFAIVRETTPDQERHQVVPPIARNVRIFAIQQPIPVNGIPATTGV